MKDKKAILNIQNKDEKCFLWCVLAALQSPEKEKKPFRTYHYKALEHQLNVTGIDFSMKVKDIPKFEKQSINVFRYEENDLFPVYISEGKKEQHINLHLISNKGTNHYCLIRNLHRLLSSQTKHNGRRFYCNYCLYGFAREDLLLDHEPNCRKNGFQKIKLQNEGNDLLYFKELHKQLKVPFFNLCRFRINFNTMQTREIQLR